MSTLQQGAVDGLSHTTTHTTEGGGANETIYNGNDSASTRKNSNDGASNEDVVLPPEGMLLCLFTCVCISLYTFNLTYNVLCCLCLLCVRDTYTVFAIMMECK